MNKYFILLLSALILFAGCSEHHNEHDEHEHEEDHGHHDEHEEHHESLGEIEEDDRVSFESKPTITTTFYPLQEITQAIVKDRANVDVIVDLGVDPHSFEPTPKQLVGLSNSQLYIGMGGIFESIEEEVLEANEDILSFDAAHDAITIKPEEHDHHDEHGHESHEEEEEHEDSHDEHNHGEFDYDPHIWLSIENMKIMTNEILEQLIVLSPENEAEFRVNAQMYLDELTTLENEFTNKLATCEHDVAIVNHKAFGYLAKAYGFEQVSIAGFSPESEPTPQTLQKIIDEAKEHNLTYVFSEGQLDAKVAQTIAQDIGGEVLELNPLKMSDNETYFSIMRNNLDNLALGLNCQN